MEKTGRVYLEPGQPILLSSTADRSGLEEFEILSVIGEGGTAVCYEARRFREGYSETGKLKEFYPMEMLRDDHILTRQGDGQLAAAESAGAHFFSLCQEYLDTYRLLWKVMENPKYAVLRNYIQMGEFFYGSENGTTVYIWSPGLIGVEFEQYLREMAEAPEKQAEFRLNNILRIMISLTNCIRILHTAGIMHLDVKPANFMIPYDSYMRVNPDHISVFDINTLYPVNSGFPVRFAGTEGYRAPEVLRGKADNRSDIYSIGATLYRAVVLSADRETGGLYRDDDYESIDVMVKNSALIAMSAANSDYLLVQMLVDILKKCLAKNPRNRYGSCTELLCDLRAAAKRASVGEQDLLPAGEQGSGDPGIVIRKLLYEHPLYEALEQSCPVRERSASMSSVAQQERPDRSCPVRERAAEEVPIHVLVVGAGTYGQKFIDLCLQAGQMKGYSLNITAVSGTAEEDRASYLQFRPDLSRFVDVDGSMKADKKRAYASLNFAPLPKTDERAETPSFWLGESQKAFEVNQAIVSGILSAAAKKNVKYHYIFVALRSNRLNRSIAHLFAQCECPVCHVLEREDPPGEEEMWLYPVCVSAKITPENIDPQLEQMAFNTHLSWNSSLNIDVSEALKKFRANPYHYASSLSYALSMKYKLYSMGIVAVDDRDWTEEADRFAEEVLSRRETDASARESFDILVWLEHRRWVLSLVTNGWTAPMDADGRLRLEDCLADRRVNNPAKRTHPCLVFSSVGSPLGKEAYTGNDRAKWEDPRIDPQLDDLDRLSLELHQLFRANAEKLKSSDPLHSSDMETIRRLISDCGDEVGLAYRQFCFCLKNILNGVESYTRQYEFYEREFRDSLDGVPGDVKRQVEERLSLVSDAFFPVIEANLYRDYKKNDETMIERIPFILSYHFQPSVAMAFEDGREQDGRNEAVFANVAAATVLSPERIHYLYSMERGFRAELLKQKLSAVLHYLGERKIHCAVTFTAACMNEVDEKEKKRLEKALEQLKKTGDSQRQSAVLTAWEILPCADREEAANRFLSRVEAADQALSRAEAVDQASSRAEAGAPSQSRAETCDPLLPRGKAGGADLYDGSTRLFSSALDNAAFLGRVLGKKIPCFEFDWKYKRFTKHVGCDYLRYIRDDSYIRISDMFSLMKAADHRFHLPEFMDDYEELWGIYTGGYLPQPSFEKGVRRCNRVCTALADYEENRPPLASLAVLSDRLPVKRLIFELPSYTFRTVRGVLEKLIKYGAAGSDSMLVSRTSENCRLEIYVNSAAEAAFRGLFSRHDLLLDYYGVTVTPDGKNRVRVDCSRMDVTKADLGANSKESFAVLEQLEAAHYISCLTRENQNPAVVSFRYASPRIRSLLTSAGEILEIYTYYQVLKTGYFDDVATGYEFYWEEGSVKNEMDLVLTKGFRSVIAECKAVQKLDLNYYHKLDSIADHFGIGVTRVLIGNTYRHDNEEMNAVNRMQRSRGSQLNIKTISNREQIENIGETLKQLMEEG
ncbi:MAG: DUF1887 family CARF protein [Clostridiales bacterium]|nr:DUF1887 family CARF protein [Clostridiales bacterium]